MLANLLRIPSRKFFVQMQKQLLVGNMSR